MRLFPVRVAPALLVCVSSSLLTVLSAADTYTVDDDGGPGVDFTDLPPAVAAALPGDVLLVQPGSYSGFVLSEGIAILAQGDGVEVLTATTLSNLPFGQSARVLGLEFARLSISGCQGEVVLDDVAIEFDGPIAQALHVVASPDVRLLGATIGWGSHLPTSTSAALRTLAARVELVASQVIGPAGPNGSSTSDGGNGGHGAHFTTSSRAHLVLTSVAGGKGGNGSPLCFPTGTFGGNGGDGVQATGSSTLLASGSPGISELLAGSGGGFCFGGAPGLALKLQGGSFARHTGQTVVGSTSVDASSRLQTPALLDPYMERSGVPLLGTQVRFNVYGEAGDQVTLFLGRNAVVQPLPGVLIEKLTTEERAFSLGAIPAGGFATFAFPLPPWMQPGFTFYGQARVLRGSEELRTNSIPVVVR